MSEGGVRVELDQGRVVVRCGNCARTLSVGQHTGHTVVANPSGVNVEPEFSCECGLIMRVRRGEVQKRDWVSLPARTGVRPAEPGAIRPAAIILGDINQVAQDEREEQ